MLLGDGHRLAVHVRRQEPFHSQQLGDDEPGGDEDGVLLLHQLGRLLVEVAAVLDRLHPGAERGHDAGLAVAVGGDRPLGAGRLLDDGA